MDGRGVERGVEKLSSTEIRRELRRLKGASDQRLREYDEELREKRVAWYKAECPDKTTAGRDPLAVAYHVLLSRLGVQEEQAPVVRRNEREMVFHSKNFCPTLEACRILGLDTRKVCRLYNERSTDALVRQVDSRLRFSRNYERIRPYADFCEESISLSVEDAEQVVDGQTRRT